MKVWIILLSLLSAAAVWHWGPHRQHGSTRGWRGRRRQIAQSLVAGVVVYFSIMSMAALYLTFTRA